MSCQNTKIINAFDESIKKHKYTADNAKKDMDTFIEEHKINKNILLIINNYIRTHNSVIKLSGFGSGISILNKPSKQQANTQIHFEETVKGNSILYGLIQSHVNAENILKKSIDEQNTYMMYRDTRYEQIAIFLTESGYLVENNISEYGKMASLINECNPFILTEIFTGNILQGMHPIQIVCFLSILTDKIPKINGDDNTINSIRDITVKNAIIYTESRIQNYIELEQHMGLMSEAIFWDLSYDYVELTEIWCGIDLTTDDHTRILQKLYEMDEYEGTFIKNMLKINNIVSNLITLCDFTQQYDILPSLKDVNRLIVKGMVNVDSLHVI